MNHDFERIIINEIQDSGILDVLQGCRIGRREYPVHHIMMGHIKGEDDVLQGPCFILGVHIVGKRILRSPPLDDGFILAAVIQYITIKIFDAFKCFSLFKMMFPDVFSKITHRNGYEYHESF